MPILHNMQASGNCYKVRLVAHQLGIPLTIKEYAQNSGQTRQHDFLAKNPNGRVPLLEFEDGRMMAESNAIIWYLSEGTKLQPDSKWGRGIALQWMFFEQYSHEPYIAVMRRLLGYAPKEEREAKRDRFAELTERGNAALGVMQARLAKNEWFAGGRYSVADAALYAYTHCAGEGGFELDRFPAVRTWLSRVEEQPGFIPL
ncbi:MAG: glutathione S-transferase family protein [Alphaproteobacteria bacterium]